VSATSTTTTPADTKRATPAFSLRQRIVLWFVTALGYLAIRFIGPTLRFTASVEDGGPEKIHLDPGIMVFWHRCVFPATYFYRKRGIAVMTSQSFDGEYIARIIERFGFSAPRGSSSRGGVRALLGMHKIIDQGLSVAFTIDGPRGPMYVAKPGPVLLARNTRAPIYCFYIALENAWIVRSWDQFMIPKPFSRALLRVGKLIQVPPETDSAGLATYHAEMQEALDRLRQYAEGQLPGTEAKIPGDREIGKSGD
jgi:lysophospholipid acyltransferase (LPLAT)-like uncharacterized protein